MSFIQLWILISVDFTSVNVFFFCAILCCCCFLSSSKNYLRRLQPLIIVFADTYAKANKT